LPKRQQEADRRSRMRAPEVQARESGRVQRALDMVGQLIVSEWPRNVRRQPVSRQVDQEHTVAVLEGRHLCGKNPVIAGHAVHQDEPGRALGRV
jgi:hypothetical protein